MEDAALEQLGQTMLAVGRDLFTRQKLDVYTWQTQGGDARGAWVLDPLKLQMLLTGKDGAMNLHGGLVDMALSRHLGREIDRLRYERRLHPFDFLGHVSDILRNALPDEEEAEELQVTFIPRPGYPWPTERYYSARGRRWVDAERPSWLLPERVVNEGQNVDSYGVDLCAVLPEGGGWGLGGVVGEFSSKGPGYMVVSHAMGGVEGVTRQGGWPETAESINACGGLLMPSLGVGVVTPSNFGLAAVVADVGLVVGGLRPYKGRGAWPIRVYDTDAWTGTTGEFLRHGAVAAFDQMHGHCDYMSNLDTHVWLLGAPEGTGGPAEPRVVESTQQLASAVRRRLRLWPRELTPEQIEARSGKIWNTPERYPYLEAKVNGVVPMSAFPMAIAPPRLMSPFSDMLERTAFDGELVEVELPDEVAEVLAPGWWPSGIEMGRRDAIQQWAWLQYGYNAADAIREHGRAVTVEVKR